MDQILRRLLLQEAIVDLTGQPLEHVAFSGTREGMTLPQSESLRRVLSGVENVCLHHGDDKGADYQAHALARELNLAVIVHPPNNLSRRRFAVADETRAPKPYLARNRDMVDESSVLIATPRGFKEELRSGTWATIRYARKEGKPVIVIYPDGTVITEVDNKDELHDPRDD